MNLADEIGSDLAVAFLVEKKYSNKMNRKEIRIMIGKLSESLRRASLTDTDKPAAAAAYFPETESARAEPDS